MTPNEQVLISSLYDLVLRLNVSTAKASNSLTSSTDSWSKGWYGAVVRIQTDIQGPLLKIMQNSLFTEQH